MERRKFLIGAGALASGSAAAVGTGAFTSVSADRGLTIETADDNSAFLGIEAQPNSPNAQYVNDADGSGDLVEISVTETEDDGSTLGSGVNQDGTTIIRDMIKITNNGTQGVIVGHKQDFATQDVYFFHDDERYKPGGGRKQAGEVTDFNLGDPDNSGTNVDTIADKNLAYLEPGQSLKNFGMAITDTSVLPFTDKSITFVAASDPSEL
jgi:hypothetical protein